MASITRETNGRRTIQFVAGDGKRKSLRLGKVPQRLAEEVKVKVEALNAAAISGLPIDNETAAWVARLGDDLAEKLAAVGLVAARASMTLGGFLDNYVQRRGEDKPRTADHIEQSRRRALEFFGADKDLRSITPGNGDDFLVWLKGKFASTTAARTFRRARQFFRAAVRSRLLPSNPLDDIKTPSEVDTSKQVFITTEATLKVIEELPSLDLKVVVALARFGGLRIPSELTELRWEDVLWDKGRLRITSPKTEHHEGRGDRWIPLFPEVRRFLDQAWDAAPEGSTHIIQTKYRAGDANLRTPVLRAIRHAGIAVPPKLFINMRSSRETELAERFPLHVVTAWMGNTARVAQKHYLQVTDDHFARGAESGAVAVQNPVQQPAAASRTASHQSAQPDGACDFVRLGAVGCSEHQYTKQDSNL
jgi:integrase